MRRFLPFLLTCLLAASISSPGFAQDELPPEIAATEAGELPNLPLPGMEDPQPTEAPLVPSITLSRADFDEQLSYSGEARLDQWLGDIEIEGGLGQVFFPNALRLRGNLKSYPDTDISIGGELRCDGSLMLAGALRVDQAIRVGGALSSSGSVLARAAISVGADISLEGSIAAGGWLYSGGSIRAAGRIWSGGLLECRGDIISGGDCGGMDGIRCGGLVDCGGELSSGSGILSGGSVTSKGRILLNGLLFCGTDPRAGEDPQAVVRCSELVGGELAWGTLEIVAVEE